MEIMLASTMNAVFVAFFALLTSTFQTRAHLHAEILALRHQLGVVQRNAPSMYQALRPSSVDLAGPILVELALFPADRSTRHRPPPADW